MSQLRELIKQTKSRSVIKEMFSTAPSTAEPETNAATASTLAEQLLLLETLLFDVEERRLDTSSTEDLIIELESIASTL